MEVRRLCCHCLNAVADCRDSTNQYSGTAPLGPPVPPRFAAKTRWEDTHFRLVSDIAFRPVFREFILVDESDGWIFYHCLNCGVCLFAQRDDNYAEIAYSEALVLPNDPSLDERADTLKGLGFVYSDVFKIFVKNTYLDGPLPDAVDDDAAVFAGKLTVLTDELVHTEEMLSEKRIEEFIANERARVAALKHQVTRDTDVMKRMLADTKKRRKSLEKEGVEAPSHSSPKSLAAQPKDTLSFAWNPSAQNEFDDVFDAEFDEVLPPRPASSLVPESGTVPPSTARQGEAATETPQSIAIPMPKDIKEQLNHNPDRKITATYLAPPHLVKEDLAGSLQDKGLLDGDFDSTNPEAGTSFSRSFDVPRSANRRLSSNIRPQGSLLANAYTFK